MNVEWLLSRWSWDSTQPYNAGVSERITVGKILQKSNPIPNHIPLQGCMEVVRS